VSTACYLIPLIAEVVIVVDAGSLQPPEGEVLVRLDLAQQGVRRRLVIRNREVDQELEHFGSITIDLLPQSNSFSSSQPDQINLDHTVNFDFQFATSMSIHNPDGSRQWCQMLFAITRRYRYACGQTFTDTIVVILGTWGKDGKKPYNTSHSATWVNLPG